MGKTQMIVYVLVACLLALSGCPQPLPPTPPGPTPDPFAGKIFDCTDLDTSGAVAYATTCADREATGECLVNYASTGVPAALLACAARDAEVSAFVEVGRGTASEVTQIRASRLRAWLRAEGMTLRGAP